MIKNGLHDPALLACCGPSIGISFGFDSSLRYHDRGFDLFDELGTNDVPKIDCRVSLSSSDFASFTLSSKRFEDSSAIGTAQ